MRPKILHIVPSLGQGGAERVLANLLDCQSLSVDHHIVSLLAHEPFFRYNARTIETLGLRRETLPAEASIKLHCLRRHVNRIMPDLVHGWLYHGNFFSAAAIGLGIPILWSIHNTTLSRTGSKRATRLLNYMSSAISRYIPDRILYCSETARLVHERAGYTPSRGVVIYNGVDLSAFRFDALRRRNLRKALHLREDHFVIAAIGRYDPQKNHSLIVRAFARAAQHTAAHLLLAGGRCSAGNMELVAMLDGAGVRDRTTLLGPRDDVDALLSASDVLVIGSSYGEALPMIAIEAAAAGLPIVATAIGDVARFADEAGDVVPPDDADAMSQALLRVRARHAAGGRRERAARARTEALAPYSVEHMSQKYLDLYRRMIGRDPASPQWRSTRQVRRVSVHTGSGI